MMYMLYLGVLAMVERFMQMAIKEAKKAYAIDETPIGAVIVRDGKVISRGYNKRETKKNALMHAEIIAIDKACRKLGGWRLPECEIYVTLEPCPMCMGAILQSRIEKVYFGAYDHKSGCLGSACDLSQVLPHKITYQGGILKAESEEILKSVFKNLRKKDK